MLNAFQTPNREYSEELEEELFHSAGLFVVENVESLLMLYMLLVENMCCSLLSWRNCWMKTDDLSWLFVCECLYKLCSSAAFSPSSSTRKILQRCYVQELPSVSCIKIPFEAYFYRTGTSCQHWKLTRSTIPLLIFASMSDLLPLAGLLAVVPIYGAVSRKIFCSYISSVCGYWFFLFW